MKLNSTQLERTLSQFTAEVLPDDHPALKQLSNIYGDHTFFLNDNGLTVLEPAATAESDAQTGEIVSLATGAMQRSQACGRTSRNRPVCSWSSNQSTDRLRRSGVPVGRQPSSETQPAHLAGSTRQTSLPIPLCHETVLRA
jgi:hypothetical protein